MTYTKEEQKQHRAELVEALRSGRYKQGRNALRNQKGRFCCLGVACDISGLGKWVINNIYDKISYLGKASFLPKEVMAYYGFSNSRGKFGDSRITGEALSYYNDAGGYNFKEIANLIEREPRGMFV